MCCYRNQLQLYCLIKVRNKKQLTGSYYGRPRLFNYVCSRAWLAQMLFLDVVKLIVEQLQVIGSSLQNSTTSNHINCN